MSGFLMCNRERLDCHFGDASFLRGVNAFTVVVTVATVNNTKVVGDMELIKRTAWLSRDKAFVETVKLTDIPLILVTCDDVSVG
jgi:hypothetical protein